MFFPVTIDNYRPQARADINRLINQDTAVFKLGSTDLHIDLVLTLETLGLIFLFNFQKTGRVTGKN